MRFVDGAQNCVIGLSPGLGVIAQRGPLMSSATEESAGNMQRTKIQNESACDSWMASAIDDDSKVTTFITGAFTLKKNVNILAGHTRKTRIQNTSVWDSSTGH